MKVISALIFQIAQKLPVSGLGEQWISIIRYVLFKKVYFGLHRSCFLLDQHQQCLDNSKMYSFAITMQNRVQQTDEGKVRFM